MNTRSVNIEVYLVYYSKATKLAFGYIMCIPTISMFGSDKHEPDILILSIILNKC